MEEESRELDGPGVVTLTLLDRTLQFSGELVADATTETAESTRWTELELYRVTDGTGRWVLHVIGRSVLFHRHDGECNTGIPVAARDLDEDAEPCTQCAPTLDDADVTVDRETDRVSAYVCDTVVEIVDHLRVRNDSRRFTTPGLRLLERVVAVDPLFAAVLRAVEQL